MVPKIHAGFVFKSNVSPYLIRKFLNPWEFIAQEAGDFVRILFAGMILRLLMAQVHFPEMLIDCCADDSDAEMRLQEYCQDIAGP